MLFVRNVAAHLCGDLFHGFGVVVSTVLWCPTDSVVVYWGICTDNIFILDCQSNTAISLWSNHYSPKKRKVNITPTDEHKHTHGTLPVDVHLQLPVLVERRPHIQIVTCWVSWNRADGFREEGKERTWFSSYECLRCDVVSDIYEYDVQRCVVKWTIARGPLSCICRQ